MKSIAIGVVVAMSLFAAGSASAFEIAKCKTCHAIDKDMVGPSFKSVAEKYGSAQALASVFKAGFRVEDRKLAQSSAKWRQQARTMTGAFNSFISMQEDDAALAVFNAVQSGKM